MSSESNQLFSGLVSCIKVVAATVVNPAAGAAVLTYEVLANTTRVVGEDGAADLMDKISDGVEIYDRDED